jgi:NAD(P)H-flavin reductase
MPEFRPGYASDALAADLGDLDLDGWKAYLAGPPAMAEPAGPVLRERGLHSADIHADIFLRLSTRRPDAAPAIRT